MVTNTELTIDMITQESLIILKNSLGLGDRCLRQFDKSFGVEGAKIGDSLRVRIPPRYVTTSGPAAGAQPAVETYKPVAAQQQMNIVLSFGSAEMSLAIDDFSKRFLEPAVSQMASDIDLAGATVATSGYTITNSGYVQANYAGTYAGFQGLVTQGGYQANGTPVAWTGGTVGSAALGNGASPQANASAPFFAASARLTEAGAPKMDRYCVVSPAVTAVLTPNLFTLFNPQQAISEMFEEAKIGTMAGADFYESSSVSSFTSGNWANTATVAVVPGANGTTLLVNAAGANANINAGDQFVVGGVYAVNPQTRQGNQLQVFTVTGPAHAAANGQVSLSVYPALANSGAQQTVSALPAAAAPVTFLGTSNTSTQTNFMYQKNAIALVVAPLSDDLPGAAVSRMTSEEDGLSIRFVSQYQASTDQVVKRLDILFGWAVVRPELGVLIKA